MKLNSYLDLYSLLEVNSSSREDNRAFGITHMLVKNKEIQQLLAWIEEYRSRLKKPLLSETFSSYLYTVTLVLALIAFFLGLLSGIGLLSYSGKEPVNVVYFMAMVVVFPLLTMTLTLFAMLRANSSQSVLVHVSPAFWMEKILGLLPGRMQENIRKLKISPLLANWMVIKRSQVLALCFSFGLLLALLGAVVTKDIAFSWSTTLDIDSETFYGFLHILALPWRDLFPSAVPSMELIEQSHYFRLGEKLSETMIENASVLGEWWRFLAVATVFYALFLRFLMYVIASFGLSHAVKQSILALGGTKKLLREINDPIITTQGIEQEIAFVRSDSSYGQIIHVLSVSYDVVQGWAMTHDELLLLCDNMGIMSPKYFEVGGAHSLEEDSEVIAKSNGEILFFVKAWEPPTMDFADYLHELTVKVDKVIVAPIGIAENNYSTTVKELDIWDRKLLLLKNEKVWLKR
ncbi:DUF2868 domain-containing protein [Sulfurovum sp.]|uniref:DUF2868 domain-containing protein n=1 Tax=Sulfurovum sp. TaxID=1969726 RepID=UPI002867E553|nr:DUF2868 domain-containing protein [Sulfurovum sp.]